ncbi:hypothetical protein KC842_02345 [Candidatus Nomurabacteria bacterium]|nr:hypothetical protein [Candidatus Nomurabacteria bacterium]
MSRQRYYSDLTVPLLKSLYIEIDKRVKNTRPKKKIGSSEISELYKRALLSVYRVKKIKKTFGLEDIEFFEQLKNFEAKEAQNAVKKKKDNPENISMPWDNLSPPTEKSFEEICSRMPISKVEFDYDHGFAVWQKSAPWRQEWLNGEIGGCYGFYH